MSSSSLALFWRRRMKNHAPMIARTRTTMATMMPANAPVLRLELLEVDGWRLKGIIRHQAPTKGWLGQRRTEFRPDCEVCVVVPPLVVVVPGVCVTAFEGNATAPTFLPRLSRPPQVTSEIPVINVNGGMNDNITSSYPTLRQ